MLHNKNGNKGFSLIEVIVTIAIMGIVTASAIGIFSWTANSTFKEACNNITDSLSYARTEKQAKSGDWYVEIYLNSNGKCVSDVYKNKTDTTPVRSTVNKKKVSAIKVQKIDGTETGLADNKGNYISLEYKSNGSFKELCLNESGASTEIKGIEISHSKYDKTIKLVKSTGKFFLK